MKIVWRLERATVRDVYEELLTRRTVAYTTVMTTLRILEDKGHLRKTTDDRAHVYHSRYPKEQVLKGMLREFVDRVFNGSDELILTYLTQDRDSRIKQ